MKIICWWVLVFMISSSMLLLVALAEENFKVDGVMYGTTAIVNGKIVKVGDYVNGAKVIEITDDFVKFIGKEGIFTVRVEGNDTDIQADEASDE